MIGHYITSTKTGDMIKIAKFDKHLQTYYGSDKFGNLHLIHVKDAREASLPEITEYNNWPLQTNLLTKNEQLISDLKIVLSNIEKCNITCDDRSVGNHLRTTIEAAIKYIKDIS